MKAAIVITLVVIVALALASPAHAKVPWSSVEFTPSAPVAGEPFAVVIRFWDDAAHTQPSTSWPAHGNGSLEFEGAPGRVPLTVTQTGEGMFHAEVTLPAGTWRLVAVQQFAEVSGPTDVELATVAVAEAPSASAPISAALVVGGLLVVVAIRRGRRRFRPASNAQVNV
jgi:hypothetical protein